MLSPKFIRLQCIKEDLTIFKIPGVLYSHCHFVSLTGSEPQKTNTCKLTVDADTKDDVSDGDSGSENDDDKGKDDESVLHLSNCRMRY